MTYPHSSANLQILPSNCSSISMSKASKANIVISKMYYLNLHALPFL